MPELEHEVVVADCSVRPKTAIHLAEVDRPLSLMDLDGIPTAQGDVRASLAGEVDEVSLTASSATSARFRRRDFCMFIGPEIKRKESSPDRGIVGASDEKF